jgi:hypothetical protein
VAKTPRVSSAFFRGIGPRVRHTQCLPVLPFSSAAAPTLAWGTLSLVSVSIRYDMLAIMLVRFDDGLVCAKEFLPLLQHHRTVVFQILALKAMRIGPPSFP